MNVAARCLACNQDCNANTGCKRIMSGMTQYPKPVYPYGWICPRCEMVHAPTSLSCQCKANVDYTKGAQS